jgi:hypothetical protein
MTRNLTEKFIYDMKDPVIFVVKSNAILNTDSLTEKLFFYMLWNMWQRKHN